MRITVTVDADRESVRQARMIQALGSVDDERSIGTLDVVVVERIRRQPILSRYDWDRCSERHAALLLEHVACPQLDERAIAEQSHILRSAWSLRDINLHHRSACCEHRVRLGISQSYMQLRLAAILLSDALSGLGSAAAEDVREQTRIIEVSEEPLDRRNIEQVIGETPEHLIPRARRAVEEAVGGEYQPVVTAVDRKQRGEKLAATHVPAMRTAVAAGREQHVAGLGKEKVGDFTLRERVQQPACPVVPHADRS